MAKQAKVRQHSDGTICRIRVLSKSNKVMSLIRKHSLAFVLRRSIHCFYESTKKALGGNDKMYVSCQNGQPFFEEFPQICRFSILSTSHQKKRAKEIWKSSIHNVQETNYQQHASTQLEFRRLLCHLGMFQKCR